MIDHSEDWEWCRQFIDHHCVLRTDRPLLIGPDGSLNTWQFYMPVATLNPQFMARIAAQFWHRFGGNFDTKPFQIAGAESGGVPVLNALQWFARNQGRDVNVFEVRKKAKAYGLKNWFEGRVLEGVPVMIVDDITASMRTLHTVAGRVRAVKLQVYPYAFAICSCRSWRENGFKVGEQPVNVTTLYRIDDFGMTPGEYVARYKQPPRFQGATV